MNGDSTSRETTGTERRQRYAVEPRFLYGQSCWLMGVVFAVSGFVGITLLVFLEPQVRMRILDPAGNHLLGNVAMVLAFALILAAVTTGAFALWTVLVTHRISGPLGVIQRGLHVIQGGRLPGLRPLRKADQCTSLHTDYQQAIATLQAQQKRHLTALDEIAKAISTADADSLPTITERFVQVRNQFATNCELEELERAPSRFQPEQRDVPMAVGLIRGIDHGETRRPPEND